MTLIFYIALFFLLVSMGIYTVMIVLKKDDKPGNDQKSISHDIEDTKTKIPHFIVPDSLPKRVKKMTEICSLPNQ